MNRLLVCLWNGVDLPRYSRGQYDVGDLANLTRNVKRHMPDVQIVACVDQGFDDRIIRTSKYPELDDVVVHPFKGIGCGGWSHRFEALHPTLWPAKDARVVTLDLDSVFFADMSWLWEWNDAPVGFIKDPFYRHTICSTVASIDRKGAELLWNEFTRSREVNEMRNYRMGQNPSEMYLYRAMWKKHGWKVLEDKPNKMRSYKAHVCRGMGLEGAELVYLHGKPKFRNLKTEDPVRVEWEKA